MKIKKFLSVLLTVAFFFAASLNIQYSVFAANVTIAAESALAGTILRGEGITEGELQWYFAESYNGDYTPIDGATQDTYTISHEDAGRYIKFSANGVMSSNYIAVGNVSYKKTDIETVSYNESYPLVNAFDGDPETGTALTVSNVNDTHYLSVDLGEIKSINQVNFILANNRINWFSIEVSTDNSAWAEVYSNTGTMGRERTVTFQKANARYVKVNFTVTTTASVKFKEIEVFSVNLPKVENVFIEGNAIAGETLSAAFETKDGATEEDSIIEWYTYDENNDLSPCEKVGSSKTYTVSRADGDKYIRCHITPKNSKGVEGETVKSEFTDKVELPPSPTVQNITVSGEAVAGNTLFVSFNVENGAAEENSLKEWYGYQSPSDDADNELLGTGTSYTIRDEDTGKYIRCRITAKTENGETGDVKFSAFTPCVSRPKVPQIYSGYISGNALVGQTVRAEFSHTGDISESDTVYKWYCIKESGKFSQAISGIVGTERTLTITSAMKGKYLKCLITPKNSRGEAGIAKYTEDFGVIIDEATPQMTATNVKITGNGAEIGCRLVGVYTYANSAGIGEGKSLYSWYRSNARNDGYKKISGATERTYTITEEDKGCYLKFSVTPCEKEGAISSETIMSTSFVAVGNLAYRQEVFGQSSTYSDQLGYFTLDGNPSTYMYTYGLNESNLPYFITIDLGRERDINEVAVLKGNGQTTSFCAKVSNDAAAWSVGFESDSAVKSENVYRFTTPLKGRYLRLEMNGPYSNQQIAEVEAYYNANTIAPVIILNGKNPIDIPVGSPYTEPGFSATDDEMGDITENVIVTGIPVPTDTIGKYEITYTVKDLYSNETCVKRTINVVKGIQTEGDVAFEKNVTATSEVVGCEKENAVDGNPNTYWSPESSETSSEITVDLQNEQWVDNVTLRGEFGSAVLSLYASADNKNWSKLCEGNASLQGAFTPTKARYYKVMISNSALIKLKDFELNLSDKGKAFVAAKSISFSENLNALKTDLALSSSGMYGSVIEWSTSDTDVITKDGSIIRSKVSDKTATLSAKVTVNGESYTVSFPVTVAKYENSDGGAAGGGGGGGGGIKTPSIGSNNSVTIAGNVPSESITDDIFSDLKNVNWAKDYIEYLAKKGIVSGVGDNKFDPDSSVTREQFVKMIVMSLNLNDETAEVQLSDVKENDWYYSFVATAIKLGIINGISEDLFGAGSFVTRQDMCVMLERAIFIKNPDWQKDAEFVSFDDDNQIAQYAKNAVSKMKAANIVNGMGDNIFAPNSYMTRAQAAKVLCLMLEQVG